MRWTLLLGLSALLWACGPTRSQSRIVEAVSELNAAEAAKAEEVAVYELVAAQEYLRKAREEQSYAEYETAESLAKKARDCARLARLLAESSARAELGAREIVIPEDLVCRPGPASTVPRPGAVQTRARAPAPKTPAPPPPPPAKAEPADPEPEPPEGELPEGEEPAAPKGGRR